MVMVTKLLLATCYIFIDYNNIENIIVQLFPNRIGIKETFTIVV